MKKSITTICFLVLISVTFVSYAQVNIADPNVFNWRFYLQANPDLMDPTIGNMTTEAQARAHWVNNGVYEGRQAHPAFHSKQYLDKYSDLAQAFGSTSYYQATSHYITNGMAEGRIGYVDSGSGRGYTGMVDNITKYGRITVSNKAAGSWTNPIYVSVSNRQAGAIDSIVWNNREFINSYDHGRQVQFAWQYGTSFLSNWTYATAYGECFNPNEAGSIDDSLKWSSTSQLQTYIANSQYKNQTNSMTRPAYWADVGSALYNSCVAKGMKAYDATSNSLSGDSLSKSVLVGPGALPNLIKVSAQISPRSSNLPIRVEAPTLYLSPDLNRFYKFDASANTTPTAIPMSQSPTCSNGIGNTLWPTLKGCEIDQPIIVSNNDISMNGDAIGILNIPNGQAYKTTYSFFWVSANNMTTGTIDMQPANSTKIGVNLYRNYDGNDTYVITYIAVGRFNDVRNALRQAYLNRP